ncbi:MAG: FkbM family methyltransferase [Azoarcus sp.]|nr:FkbM family methyltransferase [Azoarcus sp.]
MADKFAALLRDCPPPPSAYQPAHPVLIYGAGCAGRGMVEHLKARGVVIAGFLDAKARPGQYIAGIPVSTLPEWLSRNDPSHYEVFIAIANPAFLPQIPELRQQIAAQGFAQCVHHPRKMCWAIISNTLPRHVENFRQYYEQFLPELARLDALLADEESRQCLMAYIRANCREEPVQDYSPADQYRPASLPAWPQPLRFVDGGAFNGDTIIDFRQHGHRFEAIAAFEPDPENFRHLVLNTASCENLIRFPCALGDKTQVLRFDANGSMGSHIAGEGKGGSISVQCVSLDEVLPDFRPNLIKMDIEGAEPEALMGAKNMIVRHRPHLAICLYHRPEHPWRIPFLIQEWDPGYRFYIRQHAPLLDLVLYAYPDKS